MWQLRQCDSPVAGFAFAVTEDEEVLAWCARELDGAFIVETREVAPEIAKSVEQLVMRGAGAALFIKSLLQRLEAVKPTVWKHRLLADPPPGFPCAVTEAGDVVVHAKSIAVADFVVELSTNIPALVEATRRDASGWTEREWVEVTVLVQRLQRRLARLAREATARATTPTPERPGTASA
jgi:hypothetical protein